jgi:hypothetical protein
MALIEYLKNQLKGPDEIIPMEVHGTVTVGAWFERFVSLENNLRADRLTGKNRGYSPAIKFVRMAFREYGSTHGKWLNPFAGIEAPIDPEEDSPEAIEEWEVVCKEKTLGDPKWHKKGDMLGHSSLKTARGYLHTVGGAINDMGAKIDVIAQAAEGQAGERETG